MALFVGQMTPNFFSSGTSVSLPLSLTALKGDCVLMFLGLRDSAAADYINLPAGFTQVDEVVSTNGYRYKLLQGFITGDTTNPSWNITFSAALTNRDFNAYVALFRSTAGVQHAVHAVQATTAQTYSFPASNADVAGSNRIDFGITEDVVPGSMTSPEPGVMLEKMVTRGWAIWVRGTDYGPVAAAAQTATWSNVGAATSTTWTVIMNPAPLPTRNIDYVPGACNLGVVGRDGTAVVLDASKMLDPAAVRLEYKTTSNVAAGDLDADFVNACARNLKILPQYGYDDNLPDATTASNFCAAIATRFGPGGTFWSLHPECDQRLAVTEIEFGNESGYSYHGTGIELLGYQYAQLAKTVSQAVTAANPGVGLLVQADDGNTGSGWVDDMFLSTPDLDDYVKGWTIHMYGPAADDKLDRMRKDLTGRSTKSFWVTEFGISTHENLSGNVVTVSDNFGWPTNLTYAQAANTLKDILGVWYENYMQEDELGIEWAFYYQNADIGTRSSASTSREDWFGLLEWLTWGAWSPKGDLFWAWKAAVDLDSGSPTRFYAPDTVSTLNLESIAPFGRIERVSIPSEVSDEGIKRMLRREFPLLALERAGYIQFQNLVVNPSAEVDETNWVISAIGLVKGGRTNLWSENGQYSVRSRATWADTAVKSPIVINNIPASAGKTYSAGANFKIDTHPGGTVVLRMFFQDSGGSNLSGALDSTGMTTTGEFQRSVLNQVAPASTAKIQLQIRANASVAGNTSDMYMDNAIVVEGATLPPYFDGDSPLSDWLGTHHNSFSVTRR